MLTGLIILMTTTRRIGLWNHAKELAKIATYNQIVAEQAAEYEALRNFASNEFFNSQSPVVQQVNSAQNSPVQKNSKPQFPRTDNLNGVAGSGGGITAASLAEMVRNVPWNQIPNEYKQQLLNSTT